MAKQSETPLMKQYNQFKSQYPDAILLFRVGDFYETFGEDAVKTSQILGIVLTKRSNGAAADMDLAGFPHHAIDTYLPKLVRAGYRVAICDQLEDPCGPGHPLHCIHELTGEAGPEGRGTPGGYFRRHRPFRHQERPF